MKVCILGNTKLNYSWFVLTYRQGLKLNGHEVLEIDYRSTRPEEIREILLREKPRYVFTHLTFHGIYNIPKMLNIFAELRRSVGCRFIHILGDAREVPRYSGNISAAFHMALVNQTKNIKKFENIWKIPVVFSPYCCLTYENIGTYRQELDYKSLIFMGSMIHSERVNLIEKLKGLTNIKIFTTQSKEDKRHVNHDFVASNSAILSVCTGYNITHFNEVRPWQLLGSGACMIHKKFLREDDMIPDELYYHHNSDPKQIKEIYEEILKTDTKNLRQKAFEFMQKYHNSRIRLKNIIEVLEENQDSTKSMIKEFM